MSLRGNLHIHAQQHGDPGRSVHPILRMVEAARAGLPVGDALPREHVLGIISQLERALRDLLRAGGAR